MLHILSIHIGERWLEIQNSFTTRNTPIPHHYWIYLEDCPNFTPTFLNAHVNYIAPSDVDDGGCEIESKRHARRLNKLSQYVINHPGVADDDLLLFLDSDCFLVRDISPVLAFIDRHPLIAMQRLETGDQHPHPAFTLTTVGFWKALNNQSGTGYRMWDIGLTDSSLFPNREDTGGTLLQELKKREIFWKPLLRTNRIEFAPVLFGLYENCIYHHGAGSRNARLEVCRYALGGGGKYFDYLCEALNEMSRRQYELIKGNSDFFKIIE